MKNQVTCQSIVNKLADRDIPDEFSSLNEF